MTADPVTLTTAPPSTDSVDIQGVFLHVETDSGPPAIRLVNPEPDLLEIHLTPPPAASTMAVDWDVPAGGATAYWQPDYGQRRHLPAEWGSSRSVSLLRSAPVGALVDAADRNVASWALSETARRLEVRREGIREESARFRCTLTVPVAEGHPVVLRVDRRPLPYWSALHDVSTWWDGLVTEPPPIPAPATGRLPAYCTWYSMHQELTAERVERAAQEASALGFGTVIVDDGWQTDDTSRGYWYCGDWQVAAGKLGQLREHVDRVHRTGLRYLLWVAPPLLGRRSLARARFADRVLGSLAAQDADVLDPRYPEVREHLTDSCVRLLESADLDGLKLDFLDAWVLTETPPAGVGADIADVETAVHRWLAELRDALLSRRSDLLLEFRQNYTGPAVQRYGNIFRAADCPMDIVDQRTRTIDLRLMLPGRAVHSDPILWNPTESALHAAEQLLSGLFSVPQVSVELSALPAEHRRMLRYWLGFHGKHSDALLGCIEASRPDLGYPVVRARGAQKSIVAAYAELPVTVNAEDGPEVILVNATGTDGLVLDVASDTAVRVSAVRDHCGQPVPDHPVSVDTGLRRLAVPRAGLVELQVSRRC